MGAPKTPGRPSFERQLADLGPLPRFYTVLVQMKRPDFTAERIRRVRLKKAVDFEVLEMLEAVSADYTTALAKGQTPVAV